MNNMTKLDFLCLSPLLIIAIAPVILMLAITISRNFKFTYYFSLAMFLASFISLFLVMPYATHEFRPLLVMDRYGILFLGIILFSAILITILSYEYLRIQAGDREEYFIIFFAAVLGASILVLSEHFISFFLGLETLSISLYILIAYLKWRDYCIEAGVKFLVIASLSTAFLLFGMGLIYTGTGTMSFREIVSGEGTSGILSPIILAGTGLIVAAIGFKLALVPFHMWIPDIYQGAPVPVTTFIATISKAAVFALALRLFINIRGSDSHVLVMVLSGIAILSMFAGNILALKQQSLKRLLAYSSIAHMGYMLIAIVAGNNAGVEAAIFYLAAYVITSIGAFGVISILSVCEHDADNIDELKGLFWKNPWIATVLTIAMLSLAGLPLTAGFMSKFYLVLSGAGSGLWVLAFSLIINSAISLYYYLRVVRMMFSTDIKVRRFKIPLRIHLVFLIIITGILLIGILPSFLSGIIDIMRIRF
jgi:NADH-quinone oxidoreductase subunit N